MSSKCKRCGNVWEPKVAHPKQCPRCRSPYWYLDYERPSAKKRSVTNIKKWLY